jgi:hypothetical protein
VLEGAAGDEQPMPEMKTTFSRGMFSSGMKPCSAARIA